MDSKKTETMNTLRRIDEYLVSCFYTAGALITNGLAEVYLTREEIPRRLEPVDIILTCFFAASVTMLFSFIRKRRFRIVSTATSLLLWVLRMGMGMFIFDVSAIKDNKILIFWTLSILGVIFSSVAMIGQYLRHRTHHQEKTAPVEAVKVRFV